MSKLRRLWLTRYTDTVGYDKEYVAGCENSFVVHSPLVNSYLSYATETQRQAGKRVNQAAPLRGIRLVQLLLSMPSRCTVAETVAEDIVLMRDIEWFALAFCPMRRGLIFPTL